MGIVGIDPTEQAFRADRDRALADGRDNDWAVTSMILADWLEDHGRDNEAKELREIAGREPVRPSNWPSVANLEGLTPHQIEELANALRRPVGILTGGPGVGKTHSVAALLRALPADQTVVCAPTGKAAVRIGEAIVKAGITDLGARTIHQTLGIGRNGHDGGGWGFVHGARNHLPYRFVICEESSMLETPLAASLLSACRRGTHVLLIGDPDQLPPVGHGAPLRDWISTGCVPVGRLTEVHRNAGAIAQACRLIRAGEVDEAMGCAHVVTPSHARSMLRDGPATALPESNWLHIATASAADTIHTLRSILPAWASPVFASQVAIDPRVQMLAPVREKGELSCAAINGHAQDVLNAVGQAQESKAWGIRVRPGDRIVCLGNHLARTTETGEQVYVANGECGVVWSTRAEAASGGGRAIIGLFESPAREVFLRSGGDDDGFALGYCLTAHKSQGSEWPVVIIVLDDSWGGKAVMGREWIYTALSRARALCITVGQLGVIRQAIASPKLTTRKTFLAERILEGVRNATAQRQG